MLSRTFHKTLAGISLLICVLTPGHAVLDDETLLVMHWHPATSVDARRQTLAIAWLLAQPAWDAENWRSVLEARQLQLVRDAERYPPEWGVAADGLFGWLARMVEQVWLGLEPEPGVLTASDLTGLRFPPPDEAAPVLLARMYEKAAFDAIEVREQLAHRLAEVEANPRAAIENLWADLESRLSGVDDPAMLAQARNLARLARIAGDPPDDDGRIEALVRLRMDLAEYQIGREAWLAGAWSLLGAFVELISHSAPERLTMELAERMRSALPADTAMLRRIDPGLPTTYAQLGDSATALAAGDRSRAVVELADAYARLALFMPDAAHYLEQPVRQAIRQAIGHCLPPADALIPLSRELYEACLTSLNVLFEGELHSEELTGGTEGPFAESFLRREIALVSWQRIDYLAGHLNWMLGGHCTITGAVNLLDWSLAVDVLAWWVPKRIVYYGAPRWQEELERISGGGRSGARELARQMDCFTGMGGIRQDPLSRLFRLHARALNDLEAAMKEADAEFHARHFRPGADVELAQLADPVTSYRPEGLMVGPCDLRDTCGARAMLPVSRALLGLFPPAYLLADQARMGEIEMCYDQVRWVERRQRPARHRDMRVANYYARLSFDLVGRFLSAEDTEPVLRLRLTSDSEHHYLFAEAKPEVLASDCPHSLIGTPIISELDADGPGLVPRRLTYFTSAPVTAENLLAANWDRGAEWRDWFLSSDRVEVLEQADGEAWMSTVKARLHELSTQRERVLASRLLKPPTMSETDPLVLAMSRAADSSAMLRRVLEVFYPGVIRHHAGIRARVSGEDGLLMRERIRLLRDRQTPMIIVPDIGNSRLNDLEEAWLELPAALREQGQAAPELARGLELLDQLARISQARSDGSATQDP